MSWSLDSHKVCATPSVAPPQPHPGQRPGGGRAGSKKRASAASSPPQQCSVCRGMPVYSAQDDCSFACRRRLGADPARPAGRYSRQVRQALSRASSPDAPPRIVSGLALRHELRACEGVRSRRTRFSSISPSARRRSADDHAILLRFSCRHASRRRRRHCQLVHVRRSVGLRRCFDLS